MDCSLPDSSIHGIFQARVLEWVAIAFSEFQFRKKKKILEMSGDGCSTMNKKVRKTTRPFRYDLNQIPYSGSDKIDSRD